VSGEVVKALYTSIINKKAPEQAIGASTSSPLPLLGPPEGVHCLDSRKHELSIAYLFTKDPGVIRPPAHFAVSVRVLLVYPLK